MSSVQVQVQQQQQQQYNTPGQLEVSVPLIRIPVNVVAGSLSSTSVSAHFPIRTLTRISNYVADTGITALIVRNLVVTLTIRQGNGIEFAYGVLSSKVTPPADYAACNDISVYSTTITNSVTATQVTYRHEADDVLWDLKQSVVRYGYPVVWIVGNYTASANNHVVASVRVSFDAYLAGY